MTGLTRRLVLVPFAVLMCAMGVVAASTVKADAVPDRERDVAAFRFDREVEPFRWSYAVDPDRQVGERIMRVYIGGRLAERSGSLWFRHDVAVDPRVGRDVHVRIVTQRKDGTGGDNWHYWTRTSRVDLSSVSSRVAS